LLRLRFCRELGPASSSSTAAAVPPAAAAPGRTFSPRRSTSFHPAARLSPLSRWRFGQRLKPWSPGLIGLRALIGGAFWGLREIPFARLCFL
jgi:hypothetical protein